jgi:polyphosphate kinase
MFVDTDTIEAPWTVIKPGCKKRARLDAIRYMLPEQPYRSANFPARSCTRQ